MQKKSQLGAAKNELDASSKFEDAARRLEVEPIEVRRHLYGRSQLVSHV